MLLWFITIIPGFLWFFGPQPFYYFWFAFAVPALGYSIWRWNSRYDICTKCKSPLDPNWEPTNGPAVAGFLFGLMPQIPLVSGILALVLGGIGRRRAKSTGGQGASISIAALILGGLNLAGWLVLSVSMILLRRMPPPPPPLH